MTIEIYLLSGADVTTWATAMESRLHNLRIDADRLWTSLMDMARIGATPRGGCNRQALTREDAEGRKLFASWCKAAGMNVTIDRVGNMFARREGREDLPPIVIGSHLDTQPTGGKFDGVLGVLAGLEVIRCLNEAGIELRRPIEIANWTNEEGCRFAPAMLGSAVFSGVTEVDAALVSRDSEGALFVDALERMGLDHTLPIGGKKIAAYIELHIEQGPILEAEGVDIGYVVGGQGIRWFDLTVKGFERHAGSTPMHVRKDALAGAARIIVEVNAIGRRFTPDGVATVGHVAVMPNSRNVIPGEVRLTIDLRHPQRETLRAMVASLDGAIAHCRTETGLEFELIKVYEGEPVLFDEALLDVIRRSTHALGLKGRDIVSGAGHDAFHLAKVAPAAMIFTPCKDGISHNESEDITPQWATAGADVLLRTVIELASR